jgi:6-phosphogluconolactonase
MCAGSRDRCPDRCFLYAALRGPDFPVSSFAIGATAARLAHLATTKLAAAMAYRHLPFHPNGRSKRTRRCGAGILAEVEALATLPAHFLGGANAADVHVTPDGRFLYASERQTSALTGFRIDAVNGLLSPTETTPRGFAIDPRSC